MPPLTASETLDLEDLALIVSELPGHSVARRVITDDNLRAKIAERGVPSRAADLAIGL